MNAILSSGLASATKSSTPASRRDRRGRERVVARDHHGADAHPAELREPLGEAGLDGVLELDAAQRSRSPRAGQRRGPAAGDGLRSPPRARAAAPSGTAAAIASTAPLRMTCRRRQHDAAGAGLGREVADLGDPGVQRREAASSPSPPGGPAPARRIRARVTIDRPSGVSSRRDATQGEPRGPRPRRTPGAGDDGGREPVAERDRARLVEQDHVHVARRPRPRGRSSRAR